MSSSEFSAIVTGMFFLVVIASEFFVNYQLLAHRDTKVGQFLYKVKEVFESIWNKIKGFFVSLWRKIFKKKNPFILFQIDSNTSFTLYKN